MQSISLILFGAGTAAYLLAAAAFALYRRKILSPSSAVMIILELASLMRLASESGLKPRNR